MAVSQLTLNLAQGSVSFNFSPESTRDLQKALVELMQRLKAVTQASSSGSKPSPQKSMEYQFIGDVFLEVFCNPNIYPSPFAAKVLITLRDERIRLSTEAELTRLIEDVHQYLDQLG